MAVVVVAASAGIWLGVRRTGPARPAAAVAMQVTVYKGPLCECCDSWIEHLREHGFAVAVVQQSDVAPTRFRLGVPDDAASCHTASIGDYVVEGHVPADDIMRLLAERPRVTGIAAPGMPNGAPGMENGLKDAYTVVTFDRSGVTGAFATH